MVTTTTAPRLVSFGNVRGGQRILDVGCGAGVVAISARRRGARVPGIDRTLDLLQRASENAAIADIDMDWYEGDAERLPFDMPSIRC
jgi:ubiquinone/menaquinone biosynthesis C-methylase UbiE